VLRCGGEVRPREVAPAAQHPPPAAWVGCGGGVETVVWGGDAPMSAKRRRQLEATLLQSCAGGSAGGMV
jgi:hypothetical protein